MHGSAKTNTSISAFLRQTLIIIGVIFSVKLLKNGIGF